jgi:uncharacterized protein YcfJ
MINYQEFFQTITMKTSRKISLAGLAGITGLMAATISADAAAQVAVIQDSTEYAKVLNYSPIPGPQVARQVCTPVTVMRERDAGGNTAAAIAGGLVGAVVGSRFGGGHGRDAATVAGAIGGAIIGDSMSSGPVTTTEHQCQTVYEAGPAAGFQVTYDYRGKLYTTTLRTPPGEYLRVRSRVTVE